MPQITGIRADGHRVLITVTRPRGTMTVDRQHHPECPRCTPPIPCGHCHSTDGHHVHCPHF